jgi:hypothetical protein
MLDRLPIDLVDRILIFSPSFRQLAATILASPRVYGVFQARPSFIMRSVAFNIAGPVLPEAMNYTRFICFEDNRGRDQDQDEDQDEDPDPDQHPLSPLESSGLSFPTNRSEVEALEESTRLVESLELYFSERCL